jgi:hypothetical protein
MFKIHFFLLAVICVCGTAPLGAQTRGVPLPIELRTYNMELIKGELTRSLKEVKESYEEHISTRPTFSFLAVKYEELYKHPYIESDTGVKRDWFKAVYTVTTNMKKISSQLDMATRNGEKKTAAEKKEQFIKGWNFLTEAIKKQPKVDPKKLKKLRKDVRVAREKLRDKYEKALAIYNAKNKKRP